MEPLDRIIETSTTPKYLQVVNNIMADIESGILKPGERILSINETSEMYYLSRDTIEKAYKELRERGIIQSVKGKGNFICKTFSANKMRVLLLFNKLSAYKKTVYYSIIKNLGDNAIVDLHIHHHNGKICENLILENLGKYHYYVIMPHFYEQSDTVMETIKKIPANKLVILDKNIEKCFNQSAAIFQDFENDLNIALHSAIDLLYKYKKIVLIYPTDVHYPFEIVKGFQKFCQETIFEYSILTEIDETAVEEETAYIILEDSDLVNLIKYCRARKLNIGRDIGIISYNDTILKEILADGITVVSTNHEKMGETAAHIMLNKRISKVQNPFTLIRRNSL